MNYLPDNPDDRVLNARQGAAMLNVSVKTFRRLGWAGKLPPAIQISDRRLGWRKSDLRAWLASREIAAA